MLIEALFIKSPNWEHPRCLSAGQQLSKLWHKHIMEYYSPMKRST